MTMWFDRSPGSPVQPGSAEHGDPKIVLVTRDPPDWVRTPPEIGGERLRVLAFFVAPCPMCKSAVPVPHLECEREMFVAECVEHGFVWYRRPKPPEGEASP